MGKPSARPSKSALASLHSLSSPLFGLVLRGAPTWLDRPKAELDGKRTSQAELEEAQNGQESKWKKQPGRPSLTAQNNSMEALYPAQHGFIKEYGLNYMGSLI